VILTEKFLAGQYINFFPYSRLLRFFLSYERIFNKNQSPHHNYHNSYSFQHHLRRLSCIGPVHLYLICSSTPHFSPTFCIVTLYRRWQNRECMHKSQSLPFFLAFPLHCTPITLDLIVIPYPLPLFSFSVVFGVSSWQLRKIMQLHIAMISRYPYSM
jgi:hypothetical protein